MTFTLSQYSDVQPWPNSDGTPRSCVTASNTSQPVVAATSTSLHPAAAAAKDERGQGFGAFIAAALAANPHPIVITFTVMILSQVLSHGSNVTASLSVTDLVGANEQVALLELRATASLPSKAASVAELSTAKATARKGQRMSSSLEGNW